ncbi:MAG: ABC transporter permease [Bauldia sp.]|nr:ABC transporter permease [Bauldia sp.]
MAAESETLDGAGSADGASLRTAESPEGTRLFVEGPWTVRTVASLEAAVDAAIGGRKGAVTIDLGRLGDLDTAGAWLIDRLARGLGESGAEASFARIPDNAARLLKAVEPPPPAPPKAASPGEAFGAALFGRIGRVVYDLWDDFATGFSLLGASVQGILRAIVSPKRFRFTSIVFHIERIGLQGVPIVALIGLLVGGIIAQQAAFYFTEFGADVFVVDMVGLLTLREMGVLLTAIMVAGRSGSAFTAEIGAMKMREEIDALKVIGVDPAEVLVLPRLIAMVISLPLLTFVADIFALAGGAVVAYIYIDMPVATFIARLRDVVGLNTFFVGLAKAPFMAGMIAIIAAVEGLKVKGSTESLGKHTTESVVKSIFVIILLDGLFAAFFATLGY